MELDIAAGDYEVDLRELANREITAVFLDVDLYVDISAGGAFTGGFPAAARDLFRFSLDAATAVDLFTGDGNGGCPGDTTLTLFSIAMDATRTQVAYNDDGGAGRCSRLRATCPAGQYELVARGFSDRAIPADVLTAEIPDVP